MKATYRFFRFIAACIFAAAVSPAYAAGGGYPLDTFPVEKLNDLPSLQHGAKIFTNSCMGCHGLRSMRFNRLRDIGLTEDQIKDNLIPTQGKVGDLMRIPMRAADAKVWFGANPPDLSVTARSRSSGEGSGSDWLFTFLRTFYRDANRPTGWNNAVYPNVGMPHVLWEMQGQRGATINEVKTDESAEPDGHGGPYVRTVVSYDELGLTKTVGPEPVGADEHAHASSTVTFAEPSSSQMSKLAYDDTVGDLVAFLTYVSDPSAKQRTRLGMWVLMFLALFFFAAWMLNKAFWKDIK